MGSPPYTQGDVLTASEKTDPRKRILARISPLGVNLTPHHLTESV